MARHAISQSRLNCLKLILLVFFFSFLFLSQILVFIDTTAVPSPEIALIEMSKLQIEQQQLLIQQEQLLVKARPNPPIVVEQFKLPPRILLPSKNSLRRPDDMKEYIDAKLKPPPQRSTQQQQLQRVQKENGKQQKQENRENLKNKEQQLLLDKLNNAQEASALAKELQFSGGGEWYLKTRKLPSRRLHQKATPFPSHNSFHIHPSPSFSRWFRWIRHSQCRLSS